MERYLFVPSLLAALARPPFVRKALAMALIAAAALVLGYGLIVFVNAWRIVANLSNAAILGGVVFQVALVVAVYAAMHIALLRARELERGGGFMPPMLTSAPILVRALAEMYAAFVAWVAVGGGVFVWFSGRGVNTVLRPLPPAFPLAGDGSFLGGILLIFAGLAAAVAAIFIGHLIAELLERAGGSSR